ncbi:glycosyltransferase family 2 protein [Parasediminibacterium sp. JCM 36343]|uniref:glycosyltransferase family 2 protein n=1 Tax=Parasediminibacterium sp. JCM 36343 TaxID=3374279 RepID=UPI00397A123A
MKIIFWISLFLVFYTYLGYGIVLFIMIKIKRLFKGRPVLPGYHHLPTLTIIVAAYNEEDFIEQKIQNTLSLEYPAGKMQYIFVTDGSSDTTPAIVAKYPQIKLLHSSERKGKIAAMHRTMKEVTTEVVVFTDANTFLNKKALLNISRHYADPRVGAVSGEKRVQIDATADATAGEGMYWKYESKLKTWDSEMYSVVGAAGELFSIKTALYKPVPPNAIIDDFMISMLIAKAGYRIIYEPDAYASENTSENVKEELKRKIRIAAGGLQSIIWLKDLLLPFKFPLLSFQYISHRVLRWTITPFLMVLVFVLNWFLALNAIPFLYSIILAAQVSFYSMALLGWYFESRQVKVKLLFIPFYFCMMNWAVMAGIVRYLKGNQSVLWEKAGRKKG